MTIEQLTSVCFYYWYGSGGHQTPGASPVVLTPQGQDLVNASGKWVSTIRATHKIKRHRAFVDSWIIVPEKESTNQSFTIKLNPTEQNFYYDDYFRLMEANGISNIMCVSGLFDWLKVEGYSQRKSACYDHSKSPNDPTAWKDFAHVFRLLAAYFKDKSYKPTYQFGNELDFRWNVVKELTPEEIAVGQWECIKAVMEADPTAKMMLGCTLNPGMNTFNRYVGTIEQLAAAEGKTVPYSQLIWSDNHYVRDSGGNQGGGLADTPESQWTQTYEYRRQLNEACKQRGMKWEITEHGYSTSTSTSFAALKQKAPALQGVTHEEAQGVLLWRSMLMYASFSECTGVSLYHCKDGYEAEPFTFIGINYDKDFGGKEDWSSKPGKIYLEQQLDLYGKFDVVKYQRVNNIYYATLSNGKILRWSDRANVGEVTPMPKETTSVPSDPPTEPPTPPITNNMLKVSLQPNPFPNAVPLNGYSAASGAKLYIFWDGTGKTPFTFSPSGQKESGAPYEYKGGQPVTFPDGALHEVTIKDGNGATLETATFTVGTVAPPVTKEPVTEIYFEADKIYFKSATKTYSLQLNQ